MVQGNLIVSENGGDIASVLGIVKDTASLMSVGFVQFDHITSSKTQYNVPGFDFRDYNRIFVDALYGNFGPLTWTAPIDFVTWNPGPGQRAVDGIDQMYGKCVYLMLRF